jgi:phosphoglycolate phosphatase
MVILRSMPQRINLKIQDTIADFDHVIWDWNGTLVDDVDIAVESVNVLLTENGLPAVDVHTYRDVFGFPIRNYYQKLGFDFQKVSFEKLCERFIHEYNVQRATKAPLFHGVRELLFEIKKTKTQSILSAATQWHLNEITEHFDIHEAFHYRFGISDHFAAGKLERGRELIKISGIPVNKTILIGDTDHDYEVATDLGISCLLVADGHQPPHKLGQLTSSIVAGRRSY